MAETKQITKQEEKVKVKTCFIITPLGAANSDIRKKADGLIDVVIEPILRDEGFHVIPPHKMLDAGSITVQIIQQLLNADLVVCNLTGLNPNVMYELAVRHATRKPVVCLYEKGAVNLPFDIAAERTIFYTDDFAGVNELRPLFLDSVRAAMTDPKPDNPIYRVATEEIIRVEKGDGNFNSFVIDRLNDLSVQMSRMNIRRSTAIKPDLPLYSFTIQFRVLETTSPQEILEKLKGIQVPSLNSLSIESTNDAKFFVVNGFFTEPYEFENFKKKLAKIEGWQLNYVNSNY